MATIDTWGVSGRVTPTRDVEASAGVEDLEVSAPLFDDAVSPTLDFLVRARYPVL